MSRSGPFLGPDHSFPAGDAEHQRLAIGGATRAERTGNISKAEEERIKARARAMLADAVQGHGR